MLKNTKKKWILILCVIFGLCIIFGSVYTFHIAADESDDLWPEKGRVIAEIQGKEYRYDPIYLYRLTSAYFADNPDLPDDGENMYHMNAFQSIDYGHTLGEVAVALELLYLEALETAPINALTGTTSEFPEERQWDWETLVEYQRERKTYEQIEDTKAKEQEQKEHEKTYLDAFSTEQLDRLIQRHKESKFWSFQSDEAFFENLGAYETKMHCIDLGNSAVTTMVIGVEGLENEEEINDYIFNYLTKKYDVTMLP